MNSAMQFFNSSVGRKVLMALTGMFLCIFLVEHLYGNLLLFKDDGGAAFNEYSHSLVHNLLIRIVEVVLFAAILYHIYLGIFLTWKNMQARPVPYAVRKDSETSSLSSRMMLPTGGIILFFLVVHLYSFFVPYRISGLEEGQTVAQLVKDAFSNGWYALLYVIAAFLMAFHLHHGFQSAFQTLGLNNKQYTPVLKLIGIAFTTIIFLGFSSFPLIFYFGLL